MSNPKIIYIPFDTMLDIRFCADGFAPNATNWKEQFAPQKVLIRVVDPHRIAFSDPQTHEWDWELKQQYWGKLKQQLTAANARADGLQTLLDRVKEAAESVCHHEGCATVIGKPCDCYVEDLDKALEQTQ